MTSQAKQFSKSPVVKFGVQAEKPPRVTFWRLGEKHDEGLSVLVKNFRTLDQLEKKMAQQLSLMPSLYGIFTPQGKKLKDIAEIHEGMDLVAVQTGHKFMADKCMVPPSPPPLLSALLSLPRLAVVVPVALTLKLKDLKAGGGGAHSADAHAHQHESHSSPAAAAATTSSTSAPASSTAAAHPASAAAAAHPAAQPAHVDLDEF